MPVAGPGYEPGRTAPRPRTGRHEHWNAGLFAAVESGVEPTLHAQQLATRTAQEDRILLEIGRLEPAGAMAPREVRSLVEMFRLRGRRV